ncbi:hypothetical protein HJFPF1_08766 [Paramyrothecium foliicola]|nr:hypothetical protein HJFPF1_08766 [Paramyrothecium foliicola]
MSQRESRFLYNCLLKTQALTSAKKLRLLEPWRYRIDQIIIHRDSYPGLIYFEGPDPLRQSDFVQLCRGVLGGRDFKILRLPAPSPRPATLPRIQQRKYPDLILQPGAPLPPLPDPQTKKWWTHRRDVYSIEEFAGQMRDLGILGWFRNALREDFDRPAKHEVH